MVQVLGKWWLLTRILAVGIYDFQFESIRASVAGHNDFPVLGFFPGWVLIVRREFYFVCVSFFNCFLNVFWLFM